MDASAVDLCGNGKIAAAAARHLDHAPVRNDVAGHELGHHPVGDLGQFVPIRIADHQEEADYDP